MKKQRKILWRKGIHLAFSEKWNTGFGGFKKFFFHQHFCVLKAKLGRLITWSRQLRHFRCRKKALQIQKTWIQDDPFFPKTKSNVAAENVNAFSSKVKRKGTKHFVSSSRTLLKLQAEKLVSSTKNSDHEYHGEKSLLKAVADLPANNVLGQALSHRPRTELQASDFPMTFSGGSQSSVESGTVVVTLSKHKRKRFCYGYYQGLEHHRNGGPLTPKKFQLNQQRRIKVSPLMMYEKLSMIRFRYRILRSQHFRTKSKVCKLKKAQQSWVQVTGDHQETLRENGEGGSCSLFPSPELKDPSCQHQPCFPDMDSSAVVKGKNSHMPDGCTKGSPFLGKDLSLDEAFPDQQNGSATYTWDQSPCSSPKWEFPELIHDIPLPDHHSSNVFISEPEREAMTLDQENRTSTVKDDRVKLSVSGEDQSESGVGGPVSEETVRKESSCQMDEDGSLKQNILSSKLLDHPYCKSPLEAPLTCSELKLENQVGGGKTSQNASPVDDEQLSICLSGFLDEVMKKYGSLVPLSEKDVLGRLKDVFNEDFSNRKPFINREITNYRATHQKCNFRVFYNKHMLDMDDLATLDGQNWLNDQVINMYGELIMDAVPDKVHFFNSFFHRQLVTKGYNGVKRWTKKVDLFKKSLLLIPIHLEVHWSLITVTLSNRIISFYDSQGIHFKFCVENIKKYLLTEAREKNRPEFLQGWQTAVTKCIPQQKNDSDCGVFVLQYCKCLALEQPFQFSQEDMPRVRKRIYKELCECRLMD
ncbi:sentrin-specific protease 5 isoform X1 [Pteronotus mesoamericanus]|uniref:sentrin-specific protease 5 isoform X1 n=1 Tax=Pteronotus mesoamericanus TaxID=1884717 RepID=UPI0023EB02EB|nr:sentrin-specific protease 5 isoform X1 [Pteronotus parnellii mesoamericanus]XP_054431101.1 sentrin-specific protease 5 isoform X1 [Pteronotus parnellii mesoamericanus]XP_054431102.1 sentrin-specific protease 5 isoform X1 [Pteronotus parnellii mesoamericanus]